jgi:Domain of unknown function (DUF222)
MANVGGVVRSDPAGVNPHDRWRLEGDDRTFGSVVKLHWHADVLDDPFNVRVLSCSAGPIALLIFSGFSLTVEHVFDYDVDMEIGNETSVAVLGGRLRRIDASIAKLTAERFGVIGRIAELEKAAGVSERKVAATVAGFGRCTPEQAGRDVALAGRLAVLPGVVDALASGAITAGEVSDVVDIAQVHCEAEAVELAGSLSPVDLKRQAAVSRGCLADQRAKATKERYLAFSDVDEVSVRVHGRLAYLEAKELEQQLRKIADRLELGAGQRSGPGARMADALFVLTKGTASHALARHTASAVVVDYDEDPFPETEFGLFEEEPANNSAFSGAVGQVVKADTRIIVHWNAATGIVNYENGPPIDHPRLTALLCDATIDVQHCDPTGLPTGLVTSATHANWRQDRYLAHRDGVCRYPSCPGIGKTHAHHLFDDRADRTTDVAHMINLCNHDHTMHHDGQLDITGNPEGVITFTHPDGRRVHSPARATRTPARPKPTARNKHPQGASSSVGRIRAG